MFLSFFTIFDAAQKSAHFYYEDPIFSSLDRVYSIGHEVLLNGAEEPEEIRYHKVPYVLFKKWLLEGRDECPIPGCHTKICIVNGLTLEQFIKKMEDEKSLDDLAEEDEVPEEELSPLSSEEDFFSLPGTVDVEPCPSTHGVHSTRSDTFHVATLEDQNHLRLAALHGCLPVLSKLLLSYVFSQNFVDTVFVSCVDRLNIQFGQRNHDTKQYARLFLAIKILLTWGVSQASREAALFLAVRYQNEEVFFIIYAERSISQECAYSLILMAAGQCIPKVCSVLLLSQDLCVDRLTIQERRRLTLIAAQNNDLEALRKFSCATDAKDPDVVRSLLDCAAEHANNEMKRFVIESSGKKGSARHKKHCIIL